MLGRGTFMLDNVRVEKTSARKKKKKKKNG